jgi:hypothetical protein
MNLNNGKEVNMIKPIEFDELALLEIGNSLEIAGVFYANDIKDILIMLPDEVLVEPLEVIHPTLEQWTQIIKQSDMKEVEGMSKGQKIILRKSTRQIEQKVSWEVFRRDNYTCRYCGANDQPLTVDHVVVWEEMGPSIPMNLISSCKKCNNKRGTMRYEAWIESPHYLSNIPKLPVDVIAANVRVIADIPYIKEHLLRNVRRSR